MRSLLLTLIAGLLALSATPYGQTPRDGGLARTQPDGKSVAGTVLDGATHQPIYRATVQLQTGNLQTTRVTSTDVLGRWSFRHVLDGEYGLTVSRDGYVTTAFGQKDPHGRAAILRVPTDPQLDTIDVLLPRGAVISGRIIDDIGQPIGGALVSAQRVRFVNGQQELVEVGSGLGTLAYGGLTDDRGEYRIYGLAPGRYYIAAGYGRYTGGQSDDRTAYPLTYFPGTPLVSGAQAVTASVDAPGSATFSMNPTPLVNVAGRAVDGAGAPVQGTVWMGPVASGRALDGFRLTAPADRDGHFTVKGVPQGDYVLVARVRPAGTVGGQVGLSRVTIGHEDVDGVMVTTSPAGSIAGKLVNGVDGHEVTTGDFYLAPVLIRPTGQTASGSEPTARPNATGDFVLSGLVGRATVRLLGAPPGWVLQAVMRDGQDVTDTGFEIPPAGQAGNVAVVVTQRVGSVVGTARDARGLPVGDATVVAFSPDERKWGPRTRFIKATTTRTDGTFTLGGLLDGNYLVVAARELEDGDETDPGRLAQWKASGLPVTIVGGTSSSLELLVRAQ